MSEQYGFFVDTSRCIKCWACQVACKQWNGIQAGGVTRRWIVEETVGTFPAANRVFTSTACNHCENPACVQGCPTGALSKRDEDGMVVFDKSVCIGCGSCGASCPFGVPQYDEAGDGHMEKCDGCAACGRTPEDKPHCVATCPTQALKWGTLAELEEMAAAKGGARLEGETGPCVFIA